MFEQKAKYTNLVRPESQDWSRILAPLLIGIIAFALYFGFISRNYQTDGIVEADYIQNRHWTALFTPNHILNRPLGWVLYEATKLFGYSGKVLPVLEWLSPIFGAAGVVIFYFFLKRLTNNIIISLLMIAFYALSRGYWYWSTTAHYYVYPAPFIFLAGYWLLDAEQRFNPKQAVKIGLALGMAALLTQYNLLLGPIFGLAFLIDLTRPWRDRFRQFFVLGFSMAAFVAIPYLLVGFLVRRLWTLEQWINWLTRWDGAGGVSLPINGWFAPSRFVSGFWAYIESHAPPWRGIALRTFFIQGNFEPERMIAGMALLLVLSALSVTFIWVFVAWRGFPGQRRATITICLVLFGVIALFGIWWEPHNTRYYFTPAAAILALTALFLSDLHQRLKPAWQPVFVISGLVVVILLGTANFVTTVGRNHYSPNPGLKKALFLGKRMQPGDLFVASHWDWATYIPYFTDQEMLSISSMPGIPDRESVLLSLQDIIEERRNQGRQVYIARDPARFYSGYWKDIQFNTGLTRDDIKALRGDKAVWIYEEHDMVVYEMLTPTEANLLE